MTAAGPLSDVESEIQATVDRETRAWDTQDVDLLISVFHPDMVWPWPPTARDHDPMEWVMEWGRYDADRWRDGWQQLFDTHELVRNERATRRIVVSDQGDGAFAVVDIDTAWRDERGAELSWSGRTCKIYTKMGDEWKMIAQTGVLDYSAEP
jgi:ketosteroid isomerase-like protein